MFCSNKKTFRIEVEFLSWKRVLLTNSVRKVFRLYSKSFDGGVSGVTEKRLVVEQPKHFSKLTKIESPAKTIPDTSKVHLYEFNSIDTRSPRYKVHAVFR